MGIPVETGGGRFQSGRVTRIVEAQFTRPDDTTQYSANDIVSDSTAVGHPLLFADCARFDGGGGLLQSALMFVSTDAATNPNFDLVLFDTSALTIAADNAAGTVTDAQAYRCVAVITFNGTATANTSTVGGNLVIGATNIGQRFRCADGSRDLWGLVIDRGGYTPPALEIYRFKLAIAQD